MKNYEKYAEEIKNFDPDKCFCDNFVIPHILKSNNCNSRGCEVCRMLQVLWLLEEYEEPEVDWSKVEVDTPILVRDFEDQEWWNRCFAKYENGKVYAWDDGQVSWTAHSATWWKYAKLTESEEGGAE